MDVASLIDHLAAEGPLLVAAAAGAGLDVAVPGTEWNVRELVTHVGGVHRWATDIVATASPTADTAAGRAVGSSPDGDLLEWFRDGHAALVQALRAAPTDLDCFTFLPADSARHFWARRQAHETAIHRADAAAAAATVARFDAGFAQDGIAELLHGFARRRSNAIAAAALLGLDADDGASWLVTLGGDRIEATQRDDLAEQDVDAVVRGSSSEVYSWLWNRPSGARIDGDPDVAALWTSNVRIRWS